MNIKWSHILVTIKIHCKNVLLKSPHVPFLVQLKVSLLWYKHQTRYNIARYVVMEIQYTISSSTIWHSKTRHHKGYLKICEHKKVSDFAKVFLKHL
jgi:hypothetical protein